MGRITEAQAVSGALRTIGIKRAEAKVTHANLACNMLRLIFYERRAVME